MLRLSHLFTSFLLPLYGLVQGQTPTTPGFVRSEGGQFTLNGRPFQYIGTNAYWLQLLENDDLNKTLTDIAATGVRVVRTWAFNDVTEIPEDGVWFQVFHSNGTVQLNLGENGIVRLDNIISVAKSLGLRILFSLTNNWFPTAAKGAANSTNSNTRRSHVGPLGILPRQATDPTTDPSNFPRNYLSNDFGGMDLYVKHFSNETDTDLFHDRFYHQPEIVTAFNKYVQELVKRYANETTLFGWEIANDPRCNSTLPSTNNCDTNTVTRWTATVSETIKTNDPNHLVASGDSGFYCVDCDKVFPFTPPPQTSPVPGQKRKRGPGPLTRERLMEKRAAKEKKRRAKRKVEDKSLAHRIRGNWFAPRDASIGKRQDSNTVGPIYDGTFGVDTEDLSNVPGVDFNSFQFFPDQNTFGGMEGTVDLTNIEEVIEAGLEWIELHAETSNTFSQPVTITGFGLLTNETENTFSPFNSSTVTNSTVTTTQQQQVIAYDAWIDAAIENGVNIIHYQWGQTNLTGSSAGPIRPANETTPNPTGNLTSSGAVSPNDGYGSYSTAIQDTLRRGAGRIANATTPTLRLGLGH